MTAGFIVVPPLPREVNCPGDTLLVLPGETLPLMLGLTLPGRITAGFIVLPGPREATLPDWAPPMVVCGARPLRFETLGAGCLV